MLIYLLSIRKFWIKSLIAGHFDQEISKNFALEDHKHVKIEAQFYFLTKFWNGDAAYLKVLYIFSKTLKNYVNIYIYK